MYVPYFINIIIHIHVVGMVFTSPYRRECTYYFSFRNRYFTKYCNARSAEYFSFLINFTMVGVMTLIYKLVQMNYGLLCPVP